VRENKLSERRMLRDSRGKDKMKINFAEKPKGNPTAVKVGVRNNGCAWRVG